MNHSLLRIVFISLFLIANGLTVAQEKRKISIEDIWAKPTFRPQMVPGFNWMDDNSYSSQEGNAIIRSNVKSGAVIETVFPNNENLEIDDYYFNEDKSKLFIITETEPIYRHSFKAIYYIYEVKTKKLRKISEEKIAYVSPSPDGLKLAYVKDNNLYYALEKDLQPIAITKDGKVNEIINGSTDWVYEEEFSFTQAYVWSPDSKRIGFLRFDESGVKEYNMQVWADLYPIDYKFKYPKAGEKNSIVTVHSYSLGEEKPKKQYEYPGDGYIARLHWTKENEVISIQTLNRLQNHFQILLCNVASGKINVVYEEKNKTYVDIADDLRFLNDKKHFIITSDKDGFKHIYKYSIDGKNETQITHGKWEVDKLAGIDEISGLAYYTSTEASPLERQLYSIDLSGKQKKQLTERKGTHDPAFSPGYKYFFNTFSTLNSPPEFSLHTSKDGKQVKVFETNARLKNAMEDYGISEAKFFSFKTSDSVSLNAFMIKPAKMDPEKKYPVLIFVYGGPGYQSVTDSWQGPNYFWFQMLAQQGYVIVSVDNRGTGGRGADFKKITQNQLGKYETIDVIETAKYLGSLPYIDKGRIGIFGWSFGGYLASLAMTVGADYFKAGIAVAPVTSWRFYDTIYTERYLGLPQENEAGYDENSPLSHASKLKGNYLLIHGTADDNVHIQNSLAMQNALIKANKQFTAFYYPDRNHGIYGGNTRLHLYKMMTDFIINKL